MTDTTDGGRERQPTAVDDADAVDDDGGAWLEAGERRRHRRATRARGRDRARGPDQGPAAAPVPLARGSASPRSRCYALNISRVFLAGDSTSALVIGTLITVGDPVGADDHLRRARALRTSSLAMIMGFVLVIVVSGGLLSLGPSLNDSEGGEAAARQPKGPPTSTFDVIAGPGTRFNGVTFDTELHGQGRRHRDRLHRRQWSHPPLHRPEARRLRARHLGQAEKGKVELKPGTYTIYCNVTGHRARRHAGDDHRFVSRRRVAATRRRGGGARAVPRGLRRRRRRRGAQAYEEPEGPARRRLKIESGNFFFKPDKPTVTSGVVKLELDGEEGDHTLVFDDGKEPGFQLEVSGGGSTDAKKIDLKPGKYVFYCDILGHRAAGHGRHAHRQVARRAVADARRARARSRCAGSGPTRSPLAHSSGRVERLGHLDRHARAAAHA